MRIKNQLKHIVWHKFKIVRDLYLWRFERRFKKYVIFADKHKLYVEITPKYIDKFR